MHSLPPRPLRDPVRCPQALVDPQIDGSPPAPRWKPPPNQPGPGPPRDMTEAFFYTRMASIEGGKERRQWGVDIDGSGLLAGLPLVRLLLSMLFVGLGDGDGV